MNSEHSKIVYETSINEIKMLSDLTIEDIKNNPHIIKISQLKNNHVLAIIKQQGLDYKNNLINTLGFFVKLTLIFPYTNDALYSGNAISANLPVLISFIPLPPFSRNHTQ